MTASKKGNVQRLPDTKLSEAAVQARREYQRNYRKRNPTKVAQWERNKWERAAQKGSEKDAEK